MKVVNPNNNTHAISIIPRSYVEPIVLELYNEVTQIETIVANSITVTDGILLITFDFTFSEGDKYQIKLSKDSEILYRGKLLATSQDPQKYKLTNGIYFYG